MYNQHPIVHIEFSAKNSSDAGKFYGELFGWKIEDMPQFNYTMFAPPSGPGGGFPNTDDQMIKDGDVIVYVGTDDIEASLQRAESLGGRTVLPRTEIPGMGWFAFFQDPSGNRVGLYTSANSPAAA